MAEPFRNVAPSFMGLKIVENPNLTIDGPGEWVRRTWWERLFTLPWRPRAATKFVPNRIPDPCYYMLGNHSVVAHPTTMRTLLDSIEYITSGTKW